MTLPLGVTPQRQQRAVFLNLCQQWTHGFLTIDSFVLLGGQTILLGKQGQAL